MSLLALAQAIIVSGAMNYCAREPEVAVCLDARPVAAQAEMAAPDVLKKLAKRAYIPLALYQDDASDHWRIAGPSQAGDCEDRLLWAHRYLTREHPSLAATWRFVALPRRGTHEGMLVYHVVGVVSTAEGSFVIDTERPELMPWTDTPGAMTPERGVGGRWIPWTSPVS
jgi:predicted transglutaminase-like cysteine proteinase